MPRIEVDPGALGSAAHALGEAATVAREVHRGSTGLADAAAATGHPGLTDALGDFRRTWSYGLGLVIDDAQGLQRMLASAAEVYSRVERAVAAGCRR
jgi:hypothetical protein